MKFKSEKGFAMFWVIFMCMILNVTTGINMVGDTSDDLENGTSIIDRAEMAENATEEANKLEAMSLLESQIQTTYWTYFAEGNQFSTEDIESVAGVEVDRYEEIDGKNYVFLYYQGYYFKAYLDVSVSPIEIEVEIVE